MSAGKKPALWDAHTRRVYGRLLGYTRRHAGIGLLAVVGMAVDGAGLAVFTKLLQPMFDQLFANKDPYLIFWMPIWIMAIFTVRGIGTFVSNYGIAYIGRSVVQTIQRDVFAAYLRLPATFFGAEPSGQQISRITYTSEQVASASTDAVKIAVTEGVTVIGMFYVMISTSAYLTSALLVMIPLVVLIASVVSKRYRAISRRIQGSMGSVTGTVEESVGAHREVRIYGGQPHEAQRFDDVTQRTRRLNLKIAATSAMSSTAIQTVAAFALAVLVYLGTRPEQIDKISSGVFIAVLTAMGAMMPSLKRLANVQANIQRGVSAAEDLFEVMDLEPERDDGTLALTRTRGDLVMPGQVVVLHVPYGRPVPAEPGPVRVETVAASSRSSGGVSKIGTRVPETKSSRGGKAPARAPAKVTKVSASSEAARSTLRRILRRPWRRTRRSFEVNAPSLKIGWLNVLVVTISTVMPVSSSAPLKRARIASRVAASEPKGTTSSSWNVTCATPSFASWCTDSTGSRAGRVASPNWSRASQPMVHRPNENLSSGVALRAIGLSSTRSAKFVVRLNLCN